VTNELTKELVLAITAIVIVLLVAYWRRPRSPFLRWAGIVVVAFIGTAIARYIAH